MLKTVFLILLSFFAVIGIIECILCLIETIANSKFKSVKQLKLTATISGSENNVNFLLNTLSLYAQRINFKHIQTNVIIDAQLADDATKLAVEKYCLQNSNIVLESKD